MPVLRHEKFKLSHFCDITSCAVPIPAITAVINLVWIAVPASFHGNAIEFAIPALMQNSILYSLRSGHPALIPHQHLCQ